MEHVTLMGAEDVRSAGDEMQSAANDMKIAALMMDAAIDRQRMILEDCIRRFEVALDRAARAERERRGVMYPTTDEVPEGAYVVLAHRDGSEVTFRKQGFFLRYSFGGGFGGRIYGNVREATADEIAAYEAEREAHERSRREGYERTESLLAEYGLSQSDFCRFRCAWKDDDGTLVVQTRENGVGGRSIDAIRKGKLIETWADEFDTTYECYRFATPSRTVPGEE